MLSKLFTNILTWRRQSWRSLEAKGCWRRDGVDQFGEVYSWVEDILCVTDDKHTSLILHLLLRLKAIGRTVNLFVRSSLGGVAIEENRHRVDKFCVIIITLISVNKSWEFVGSSGRLCSRVLQWTAARVAYDAISDNYKKTNRLSTLNVEIGLCTSKDTNRIHSHSTTIKGRTVLSVFLSSQHPSSCT